MLIIYNAIVAASMAALFLYAADNPVIVNFYELTFPYFIAFVIPAVICEVLMVKMPGLGVIPVADIFYYSVLMLAGPVYAAVCAFIANSVKALYETVYKKQEMELHLFNILQTPLTFMLGAYIYIKTAGINVFAEGWEGSLFRSLGLLAAGLFCVLFRHILNTVHRFLEEESGISALWKMSLERVYVYLFTICPTALLITVIYRVSPISLLLLFPPLALAFFSLRRYSELLRQAKSTIEIIAESIEARDPYTVDHSERVARYSVDIGKCLKLPGETLERLESAARMHDLGLITVADDVLGKLESLSEDEFETVKKHPEFGGAVAEKLSFCREEALMIRHHHERFDGDGYPDGLKGDEIPIGARIIGAAEAFDVMTTERSYKKSISFMDSYREIEKESGKQFDPAVVEALGQVIRQRLEMF